MAKHSLDETNFRPPPTRSPGDIRKLVEND